MDFTLKTYKSLLQAIKDSGYAFQTFEDFIKNPKEKVVVLRHDVDERPYNALKMAELESYMGINSTYYFRIVKISNNPDIINKIVDLGHEIGYHYEDLSLNNGNVEKAAISFRNNLLYFRSYYPVSTVCMHGSSFSGIDNRKIWEHHSLEEFNLIAEPYLSVDFSKVFYITDTARRWDAGKYSIRDTVKGDFNLSFHSTKDIIRSLRNNDFPNQAIIQSHTLWTNNISEWLWLEVRERIRNPLKLVLNNFPPLRNLMYYFTKKVSS
ncbi:hypothetical protein GX420_03305 [bacterium]|nr:hypothetical protein [bacterium]